MARYTGPKEKLARREGCDLNLKSAVRSFDSKCKSESAPGQHGRTSGARLSDYGAQLREKQKVKRMYGVLERQFRLYFAKAARKRGNTGEQLLSLLECRLDNVVYRMASAAHVLKHVSSFPTALSALTATRLIFLPTPLRPGDVIAVREKAKNQVRIAESLKLAESNGLPDWVSVDTKKLEGTFKNVPARDEICPDVNESLIVELYSR